MRKGRFGGPAAEIAQRYSESVSFDCRPYRHDIAGSIAHANVLAAAGIISAKERNAIGAPSRRNVSAQIERWRKQLDQ